jgi:hypothetical protein
MGYLNDNTDVWGIFILVAFVISIIEFLYSLLFSYVFFLIGVIFIYCALKNKDWRLNVG